MCWGVLQHSSVALTLCCPVGALPITMSLAKGGLGTEVKCTMNKRAKVSNESMMGCSSANLNHRHSACLAHGFKKHCRVSSLHCAKVTGPTESQHGHLGKAGEKLLSTVSVGADDFLN